MSTGLIVDRIDRRVASACNFALQIVALGTMLAGPSIALRYAGRILFGLGVGNMITFPSLIVQVEYRGSTSTGS